MESEGWEFFNEPTRDFLVRQQTQLVNTIRAHLAKFGLVYARGIHNADRLLALINGISDAFVNTLKRDYVHVTPLPNAEAVLDLVGGWIDDCNENHPHSGLKMSGWRSGASLWAGEEVLDPVALL